MMSFNDEQNKLVNLQRGLSHSLKGRKWNKYRGHVVERAVSILLEGHIPGDVKIVGPAFIEGFQHEFDIMLVNKDAEQNDITEDYPYAYQRENVNLLIEVKASGFYYPKATFKKDLNSRIIEPHSSTGIPFIYLSIWENRANSKRTRKILGEKAFILREVRNVMPNEWERFVNTVLDSV